MLLLWYVLLYNVAITRVIIGVANAIGATDVTHGGVTVDVVIVVDDVAVVAAVVVLPGSLE